MANLFISPFKYLLPRLFLWLGLLGGAIFSVMLFIDDQRITRRIADFYASAPNIEILSMGNSHGESLYFPALNKAGFAFVRGGEDIYTTQRNFRIVSAYTPKLRYVYIAIGPGYLGFENISQFTLSAKTLPDIPWGESLSWNDIFFIVFTKYLYAPIVDANERVKSIIKSFLVYVLESKRLTLSSSCKSENDGAVLVAHEFGVMGGYRIPPLDAHCIERSAEVSVERQFSRVMSSVKANPDIWEANVGHLLSMADSIGGLGGKLLLVIPPFTKEYYASSKIQQLTALQAPYLQQLIAHPSVEYFDYHDFFYSSNYQEDNVYFSDPSHLSLEGAKIFSEVFGTQIDALNND